MRIEALLALFGDAPSIDYDSFRRGLEDLVSSEKSKRMWSGSRRSMGKVSLGQVDYVNTKQFRRYYRCR